MKYFYISNKKEALIKSIKLILIALITIGCLFVLYAHITIYRSQSITSTPISLLMSVIIVKSIFNGFKILTGTHVTKKIGFSNDEIYLKITGDFKNEFEVIQIKNIIYIKYIKRMLSSYIRQIKII